MSLMILSTKMMNMKHENIKTLIIKFCELILEKESEVQSVKVKVGMKDKQELKFKKFRELQKI